MDTDSIIYSHPDNDDPLTTGPHLGDFTDECVGFKITEFVSGGCKNYAYKLEKEDETALPKFVQKIRGFTLDYNTCQSLHYNAFKEKVLNYGVDTEPIVICYDHFLRPNLKKGAVYTVPYKKAYRPIVTKGIVDDNYNVINFGSSSSNNCS